jgi:hypothetical protein
VAKQLDLPVGTPPARARALQALAKKGRLRSEKLTVRDTGQQRVKLHREKLDERVVVENANGDEVLVWPEDADRIAFQVEIDTAFADFVKEHAGKELSEFKLSQMHADDPELFSQEDLEMHAALLQDFRIAYPQYDPDAEEEA